MVRPIVSSSEVTAMIRWNDVIGRSSHAPTRVRGAGGPVPEPLWDAVDDVSEVPASSAAGWRAGGAGG